MKKNIIITLSIISVLILSFALNNQNINITKNEINKSKNDSLIAIMVEQTEGEEDYLSSNVIPEGDYVLSNKSYCTVDDIVDNTISLSLRNGNVVISNMINKNTTCYIYIDIHSCEYEEGEVVAYSAAPGETTFTPACGGHYKLEVWGAQGGTYTSGYPGGYGGYSVGVTELEKTDTLYINIGGQGTKQSGSEALDGGYNGGGSVTISGGGSSSGGGATHIATETGLLSSFYSSDSTTFENNKSKILIVAGGGGGACLYDSRNPHPNGGNGGGFQTDDINSYTTRVSPSTVTTYGANQSGPNGATTYTWSDRTNSVGSFGQGGNAMGEANYSSAGGGGWYGGGSSFGIGSGAGGSGFIGNVSSYDNIEKAMYCYDCTTDNNANTKTYQSNSQCTNGYNSTATEKCAKEGDGYVRITYVGI